jgi:glycosyltransferase involved in cell wall biosynthesis
MSKDLNQNFLNQLRRITRPLNTYSRLKSIYLTLVPKGSKAYEITHGFLRIFLKRIHLFNISYQEWIRQVDTLKEADLQKINEKIESMASKPHISIIMPVYNPPLTFLEEALKSVLNQVYPFWELCIADDASPNPYVTELINKYAQFEPRIRVVFREENGHISAASNSALELAQYPFAVLFDHDDLLHPLALYYVAQTILAFPDSEIIYSDEDKITKRGRRLDPYFKPDFNYELLLSHNMVSHLGVYRTATMRAVGGFRIGLEGSQDYDLLLRILERIKFNQIHHIPFPLYHWRISRQSAAEDVNIKPYAIDSGKKALQEHLDRSSIKGHVKFLPEVAAYHVEYDLPEPNPSVAILIQDQETSKTLQNCVDSIIQNTNYPNYRIIIDLPNELDQSPELPVNQWGDKVSIEHFPGEIANTYAKITNRAVNSLKEDFVVLLDKTLLVQSPNWLIHLVGQAAQKNIGAVAPKLLYSNNVVYSSGVVILPDGGIHHISKGEELSVNGYFGWAKLTRGYSALSYKCLLFRQNAFTSVNGFNESLQTPDYCGVDFCLRLKSLGFRNILYPSVELYIQEKHRYNKPLEVSKQDSEIDRTFLKDNWGEWVLNDPAFNPNLAIVDEGKLVVDLSPQYKFPGI